MDKNSYLAHLSKYIHLNPVTAGLVTRPEDWAFSSYRDYAGLRDGTLPVTSVVLSQFPSRQAYREFVESCYEQKDRIIEHLLLD
ncbi:MAG: hypothetical protein V3S14_10980 [Anaerolineae bacterium]